MNHETAAPPAKPWWRNKLWKLPVWAWLAIVAVIAIAALTPDDDTSTATTTAETESAELAAGITTPAETTPADPIGELTEAISDDVGAVKSVTLEQGVLAIHAEMKEVFIAVGTTYTSEISDILQDVSKSSIDYTTVDLTLDGELVDELGRESMQQVLHETWPRSIVSEIVWSNFDTSRIIALGDIVFIHPALRSEVEA